MISAPNHLQRLNGNKIAWVLWLFLLPAFYSCEALKPIQGSPGTTKTDPKKDEKTDVKKDPSLEEIQGRKRYDPETKRWVYVEYAPTEKMDTIIWKDIPAGSVNVITGEDTGENADIFDPGEPKEEGQFGTQFFSSYNVAVALPFLTDKFDARTGAIHDHSYWAIHFYSGLKMALDDLESEDIRLNVSVIDTKESNETAVQSIVRINPDLKKAHLIIGPYRRDNVKVMADFAKTSDITLVSPASAASGLSSNNPNYIQVNPTLESHCASIARHALQHYSPNKIVLVSRDEPTESSRLQYFQAEYAAQPNRRDTTRLRELIISDKSADLARVNMLSYVRQDDTTVFIVPSWSDEMFIYSLLRKIDLVRNPYNHIVVYGMPQWMQYERVDYEYYEKLNVHVSSSSYINALEPQTQLFRQRYYDRYGTVPTEDAFIGYDLMLYFGRMVHKHGTKFQYFIDSEASNALHTRFQFLPIEGTAAQRTRMTVIDRFENRYVNILEFRDYQFQISE